MAQRPAPSGGSRSGRRGKAPVVQIQPKRNWGLIVGSSVLALALIGILVFAVVRQGSGFRDPLKVADEKFDGISVTQTDLARGHKSGVLQYATTPPDGGDHNPVWQKCQVYSAQIPDETAVHSLEHGAVWVTYQPTLPADQVARLRSLVQDEAFGLMSPYPGLKSPIELLAWGRTLTVDSASDPRVADFISTYANGPQTPEKGATCVEGNTSTGTTPPGTTAPAPAASAG